MSTTYDGQAPGKNTSFSSVTPTTTQFDFADFVEAANAENMEASVIVRNSQAIFTLTNHRELKQLTVAQAAQFVLDCQINAERRAQYMGYLESLPDSEVANAPSMEEYFDCDGGRVSTLTEEEFSRLLNNGRTPPAIRMREISEAEHDGVPCPVCAESAIILNVERNHFAVCHECGIYFLYGQNLFSAWRDESPEVWKENSKILDKLTEVRFKSDPPPPASSCDDDSDSIPF